MSDDATDLIISGALLASPDRADDDDDGRRIAPGAGRGRGPPRYSARRRALDRIDAALDVAGVPRCPP